jgi:hypothetical protein
MAVWLRCSPPSALAGTAAEEAGAEVLPGYDNLKDDIRAGDGRGLPLSGERRAIGKYLIRGKCLQVVADGRV